MKPSFFNMDDHELISKFVTIAQGRGAAVTNLDSERANRLIGQMRAIDRELRRRGRSARLELAPLLHHRDRFVRYYAALYLLGLLSNESRAVLEWNAKYGADSLAADARMYLRSLDDGSYQPD